MVLRRTDCGRLPLTNVSDAMFVTSVSPSAEIAGVQLIAADPIAVRLRLVGPMEVWTLTSGNILPSGRKTRGLLAIVALSSPRPVLRTRLAELLWSRRPEEQARASLRQEIHRLLDVLSVAGLDVLTVTRDSLALRPGVAWIDVEEVARATPDDPSALRLLDAELLEELDGVDPALDVWLAAEREKLRDRARAVVELLLGRQETPETMIGVAQQMLQIDRAHEGAWRALMRAYAARGERGLAMQTFDRCRATLLECLGANPSPETMSIAADIREGKELRITEPVPALAPFVARFDRINTRGGAKVGVLPMTLVGTTEAEAHLAIGLAEEITTALARFRWMFLVSSSSIGHFLQDTRNEAALRRTFGLDFVLDGSVQRVGERLRITVRLIDLRDGSRVVWARRFDRQTDDLLTLQDEVASEVVGQIDPEILLIESRRAAHRAPQDSNAYDLMLRALPSMTRLERSNFQEAGALLRRSIALEPDYAAAHTAYAYWLLFQILQGWTAGRDAAVVEATEYAERAIRLDPQDARAFTIAGHIRAVLEHRPREGLVLHERALALNPNLAMAWAFSGFAYSYIGDWAEAGLRLARYKYLSPLDPYAFYYDVAFCRIALLQRDFERAVELGRAVSELNPAFAAACRPYLAALGHLGQVAEAEVVCRRLRAIEPDITIASVLAHSPFERPQDREILATGLRLGGIPE